MSEKGLSLYEMAEAYQNLDILLENTEDRTALVEYLDGIQVQMKDKVSNIVRYSKNLELTAGAIDVEIERLTALKKSYEGKSQSLKDYISYSMLKHGIEKVETDIAKIFFRKSKSVEIVDLDMLPEDLVVQKVSFQPDKKAIKEAIESGWSVAGARIVEAMKLQIK